MDPAIGYFVARKLLNDKYGDPYVIWNAYLKRITESSSIKNVDGTALDRLATVCTVYAMMLLSHFIIYS